jgi:glycosyltransferase involved in cell wall biosynthesis
MSEGCPRVTVGVPVFNGESVLAETLDSLLNQTFSDFEIVISDNGSADRTEQICRAYTARDPRVRYYRNAVNRGAAWNHNHVFELARGEYFKWNSADDLCAPEFLARCVTALDRDPAAVMATSEAVVIDECGKRQSLSVPGQTLLPVVPLGASAHVRFRRNIQLKHLCMSIYSLIRSDVLRQTDLIGGYADSDRTLLAHLALIGHCAVIPEVLFFNRDHPHRFSRVYADDYHCGWRETPNWFDLRIQNESFSLSGKSRSNYGA